MSVHSTLLSSRVWVLVWLQPTSLCTVSTQQNKLLNNALVIIWKKNIMTLNKRSLIYWVLGKKTEDTSLVFFYIYIINHLLCWPDFFILIFTFYVSYKCAPFLFCKINIHLFVSLISYRTGEGGGGLKEYPSLRVTEQLQGY